MTPIRPSRRKRNRNWPRRKFSGPITTTSTARVLKAFYPEIGTKKPWYATLAYERRWITFDEFADIDPVDSGEPFLFDPASSPFAGLIAKSASWDYRP